MVGIYFSGTGNTKFCIERFLAGCEEGLESFSIEDERAVEAIRQNRNIVFAYPVYFSNTPKIVRDFIAEHGVLFAGKKLFLIADMGMFSGDGTGCSARLFKTFGAEILGGLHVRMPDNIGDEKLLKKSEEEKRRILKAAEAKIQKAASDFTQGHAPGEGLGFWYHMAGLLGQRLWFYNKTKIYTNKLKINRDACVGCGICVSLCPMGNLKLQDGNAIASDQCTMCYRCISRCPAQAMTLLGKKLYEQYTIEKYL